ncbi:MAG: acetolactate synthase [Proteobacteria bacterium]|jgi:acetolactate synthase-1/2/3 large subunit|nr:acetolactate synthase [Pseudomonadota bacterium]MBT5794110.1 acetolactate synthase [Deltaproteobacteria bacterium]
MTVAEAIFKAIKIREIDFVFCVPGESYLATMDSFYGSAKPLLVSARHEEGAGIMAEAYAKASSKTGVCMVTRGPGLTHLSIALHTAKQDSTPLVVFVGQVPTKVRQREAFQELDIVEFTRPVAKWAVELNRADRVAEIVDKAFHIANSGRPGPVVISLPEDIDRSSTAQHSVWRSSTLGSPAPSSKGIAKAVAMLEDAERPCIVAGEGLLRANATDKLIHFAECLGIPVFTAWRRFDAFPNKHPLYMGGLNLSSVSNDLSEPLKNADLIIAIGARLDEFTTLSYSSPSTSQKLIHIDQSPEVTGGSWLGADLALVADAGEAMDKLEEALKNSKHAKPSKARQKQIADWCEYYTKRTTPRGNRIGFKDGTIDLEGIYHDILNILTDDASITCDAGDFGSWLIRYYKWNKPRTFFGPTTGAMGYALPAAIAARLARPQAPAIAFAGDGGFAMTMSELETAVRLKLAGLVVLVFNNNNFGTIRRHQNREFPGRAVGTGLGKIDFSAIAKAMGAEGFSVSKNGEFAKTFKAALNSDRPAVIDITLGENSLDPWADNN